MKEIDIVSLARKNIRNLKPYSSARDDFEGSAKVFLDANENPFPKSYNRYPDPHQRLLKESIAKLKGVPAENIFLGNGSDEAIDLLFRVFCEPEKDDVIIPQPTYGMYKVSADVNDVTVISPSLSSSFELESQILLMVTTRHTKMIFLCSPNNPSGNLLDVDQIENLLKEFAGLVIIDEAYIDFSETKSWSERLSEFPNLVVLQTLSKAWGLAGLRLGMCFANPEIIRLLNKVKPPYNINEFTQAKALEVIRSGADLKDKWVSDLKEGKKFLVEKLKSCKVVNKVYPSDANFLLVAVTDAPSIYRNLLKTGIVVRDRSQVILCNNCLRITVGTPEENVSLINALKLL